MPEQHKPGTGMRLINTLSGEVASNAQWSHEDGTRLVLKVKRPRGLVIY
jgi:hypothetical protein